MGLCRSECKERRVLSPGVHAGSEERGREVWMVQSAREEEDQALVCPGRQREESILKRLQLLATNTDCPN